MMPLVVWFECTDMMSSTCTVTPHVERAGAGEANSSAYQMSQHRRLGRGVWSGVNLERENLCVRAR